MARAFDDDASGFCYVAEDARGELVAFAKATLHDGGVPGFAGELSAGGEFHGGYGWRDLQGLTVPSGSAQPRA
jgi:hypothetical protein